MEVYLDHAATTPVDPEVLKDMMPYFTEEFANANSQHHFARKPQAAMDRARQQTVSYSVIPFLWAHYAAVC
mgnify:CR=1 FL=1